MEHKILDQRSEEFEKTKKDILERLAYALDNGTAFLVIAEGKEDHVATAGGSLMGITKHLSEALSKSPELFALVKTAVDVTDLFSSRDRRKEIEDHADIDLVKLIEGETVNIAESLGCKTCPIKMECEIFNLIAKDLDHEGVKELIKILQKKHPEVIDSLRMGKGGEA